jgi:hypothetical protein
MDDPNLAKLLEQEEFKDRLSKPQIEQLKALINNKRRKAKDPHQKDCLKPW